VATIRVEGRRTNDWLIIEGEDNRRGLAAHARKGVGLSTARRRLQALYGADQDLSLEQDCPPAIVSVTAFDACALRAFDVPAVD
jgi:LytS/YehU family sensor histidine kinase